MKYRVLTLEELILHHTDKIYIGEGGYIKHKNGRVIITPNMFQYFGQIIPSDNMLPFKYMGWEFEDWMLEEVKELKMETEEYKCIHLESDIVSANLDVRSLVVRMRNKEMSLGSVFLKPEDARAFANEILELVEQYTD